MATGPLYPVVREQIRGMQLDPKTEVMLHKLLRKATCPEIQLDALNLYRRKMDDLQDLIKVGNALKTVARDVPDNKNEVLFDDLLTSLGE